MINKDWRRIIKEIEEVNNEYAQYSQVLTPVESAKLAKRKESLLSTNSKYIAQKMTDELYESIDALNMRRDIFASHKKREIDSWDSAKLQAEYGVTSVILDMVTVGVNKMTGDTEYPRVKKLWKEALDSQNKYKMRAISDLLDGVIAKTSDSDEARKINLVKHEAQEKVKELRLTDDIQKARGSVETAFESFSQTLREYRYVSRIIDMSTTMDWNIRNLKIYKDEDGLPKAEFIDDTPKA